MLIFIIEFIYVLHKVNIYVASVQNNSKGKSQNVLDLN